MKKINQVTIFIYPEGKGYVGVCLELGIVEEHKNIDILRHNLKEAVEGYIEAIIKNNLDKSLLNRPAPKEYWNRFREYLKNQTQFIKGGKSVRTPYYSEVMRLSAFA